MAAAIAKLAVLVLVLMDAMAIDRHALERSVANSVNTLNERKGRRSNRVHTNIPDHPRPVSPLKPTTGWALHAWSEASPEDSVVDEQVIIVDLFDTDTTLIEEYKRHQHIVICSFSAGTAEDDREDVISNRHAWQAIAAGGSSDNQWLNIYELEQLQALMKPRIQLAKRKGCQGIEPDNTDCFNSIKECLVKGTRDEREDAQMNYLVWLAGYVHSQGMLIGLKNSGPLVNTLVHLFDFAIEEQCREWLECKGYMPFFYQDKPVFGIEYTSLKKGACVEASDTHHIQMKYCNGNPSDGTCKHSPIKNCWTTSTWNVTGLGVAKELVQRDALKKQKRLGALKNASKMHVTTGPPKKGGQEHTAKYRIVLAMTMQASICVVGGALLCLVHRYFEDKDKTDAPFYWEKILGAGDSNTKGKKEDGGAYFWKKPKSSLKTV